MAYEVVMPYHLHMPSYFLETFTEYPHHMVITRIKNSPGCQVNPGNQRIYKKAFALFKTRNALCH